MNSFDPTTDSVPLQPLFTDSLGDKDKQILRESAQRLLAHGSLLRERPAERGLYDWCIEHQDWVDQWGELLGMKIVWQREERVIIALPEAASLTRKLRKDETLVAMALWYDYDVEVRENGAHEVEFTIRQFNSNFASKFPKLQGLSASRLKEILRLLTRLNLIEVEWQPELAESSISILPTLRFAIPFPDLEEWLRHKQRFDESETRELYQEGTPLPEAPEPQLSESEAPPAADSEIEGLGSDAASNSVSEALKPKRDPQASLFDEDEIDSELD